MWQIDFQMQLPRAPAQSVRQLARNITKGPTAVQAPRAAGVDESSTPNQRRALRSKTGSRNGEMMECAGCGVCVATATPSAGTQLAVLVFEGCVFSLSGCRARRSCEMPRIVRSDVS